MQNIALNYVSARINKSAEDLCIGRDEMEKLFLSELWSKAIKDGDKETIHRLLQEFLRSQKVNSSDIANLFSKMGVKDFTARLPGSNVIYISEGPVEEERELKLSWVPESTSVSSPYLSHDIRRRVSQIEIPETVEKIEGDAFEWTAIREMVFPQRIIEIPSGVCCGCSELAAVILPEGVTKIKHSAFRFCEKLEKINIPSTVEEIEDLAFEDCDLLPEDVKQQILAIGGAAAFKKVSAEDTGA